jgi:peptidoglycan/LPS O-acetylase OafA/YrhL
MLVVVYHIVEVGQWREFPVTGWALWFRIGWIGVDLFFVISGFVITLSAVSAYRKNGRSFVGDYLRHRWFRIAPLYFCTILVFVWLVSPEILFAGAGKTLAHITSHALFLHNLHPSTYGSINGPNWSVALEMQFYVLIAFIAPWLSRTSPLKVLLLFIPIAWSFRYASTLFFPPGTSSPHEQHVFSSQLPGTLDAFAFGIAIALLILNRSANSILAPSWRNFIIWTALAALLLKLSMALYWPRANYWDNAAMIIFWRTVLAGAFATVVVAAITFPMKKPLVLWPLTYLGRISYGLYLWHTLVLTTLLSLPWVRGATLLQWTLIGTIILAATSWHFLEAPFVSKAKHDKKRPA